MTDSNANSVTVFRTVNVVTGGIPVITLIGSGTVNMLLGSGYTESGATAMDMEDGNITASGTLTGSVNTSVRGTYTITYSFRDSNNNTAIAIRTINVLDIFPPIITLIGSGNMTINANSSYTDLGATWTDNVDGSGAITANGVVNTSIAGLYILSYNYIDTSGNTGTLLRRNVTVLPAAVVPFQGIVG